MNCTNCGRPILEGANFCTGCGASTGAVTGVSKNPPPLPAPQTAATNPGDWNAFFQSLGSETLNVTCPSPGRFEFKGERKVKAMLSRTTLRYEAMAVLDPQATSLQWWEKLSESSFGVAPENFGATAETRVQKGASVEIRKTVQTPGGGYTYHYGDLRAVVENEARQRGWDFKLLVLRPRD